MSFTATETPRATETDRTRACGQCQATFTPKRQDARFCSPACRLKAHRAVKGQSTASEQPKRVGKDGKPKRPTPPTPRLYAPPRGNKKRSTYSDEIIDELMRRIAHGETLRQVCNSDPQFPLPSDVTDWAHDDPEFATRFARARDRQMEAWADEIVATADKAVTDPASANGRRLSVDVRKWLLSKLKPEKYGDRIEARLANPDGTPLQAASSLDLAKALAAALQARALPAPVIDVEATDVPVEATPSDEERS